MKDIIQKLTSRKFILSLVAFLTALLTFLHVDAGTTESIISLVSAFLTLIAYVVTEGCVDVSRNKEGDNNE